MSPPFLDSNMNLDKRKTLNALVLAMAVSQNSFASWTVVRPLLSFGSFHFVLLGKRVPPVQPTSFIRRSLSHLTSALVILGSR